LNGIRFVSKTSDAVKNAQSCLSMAQQLRKADHQGIELYESNLLPGSLDGFESLTRDFFTNTVRF
jgi:hypothetical protein